MSLIQVSTSATDGAAFVPFAGNRAGNGSITNDTGVSLDLRLSPTGAITKIAAGLRMPFALVWSTGEVEVRRTDQVATAVTVELEFSMGSQPQAPVGAYDPAGTAAAAVAGISVTSDQPGVTIIRSGTPSHPVTLQQAVASAPLAVSIQTVAQPELVSISGFRPAGTTNDGEVVLSSTDGLTLLLSRDGFQTYRTIKSNVFVQHLWFDAAGNAYASLARKVFRAPAGSWYFTEAFQFAAVNGTAAPFSYTVDDTGGVYVAEYCTSDSETGQQVWRSTDYGVTWASVNVDVGQRHHHGIYWHEATNVLYLVAGEPHFSDVDPDHGRKLMKSSDRGATWATVFSFGTVVGDSDVSGSNPTSFIGAGNFFILGADGGAYGGFWLCDGRNDTAAPAKLSVRAENYNAATNGYLYQIAKTSDGTLVAPPEYSGTASNCVRPILLLRNSKSVPVAIYSPFVTRQNTSAQVEGPDTSGAFALLQKDGNTLILPSIAIQSRTGYCTASSRGFLSNLTWDAHADVISGVTFGGYPVLNINHGDPGSQSAQDISVTAGKKYRIVAVVKRGSGDAANLMRDLVWYNGDSFLSVTQEVIDLTQAPVGEFVRVVSRSITAPANATLGKCYIKNFKNVTDAKQVSARMAVFEEIGTEGVPGSNDTPWIPAGTASESYSVDRGSGLFIDRIYTQGTPLQWPTASIPLLTCGNIEIGLRSKAGHAAGDFHTYVSVGGTETEILGAPWGSQTERPALLPFEGSDNSFSVIKGVSAPLTVGITNTEVLVLNPETGVLTRLSATPGATVSMVGSAVHVPLIAQIGNRDAGSALRLAL